MPIIKYFYPFKDVLARLVPGEIAALVHQFDFQGVKEAFHDGVVPAIALATQALYDILHRDDPSSQVKAVIGEGEGIANVYTRIPSAAAAWGAIYFNFGVDPETGRQAPFSSEPTPWPASNLKFMWSMNSGWLAALMGKQAQFYDIQLYGPRTPSRGIFYPCERKILQGYPFREERSWQGTVSFTAGACQFF